MSVLMMSKVDEIQKYLQMKAHSRSLELLLYTDLRNSLWVGTTVSSQFCMVKHLNI